MIGRFYRYINRNLGGSGKDRAAYDMTRENSFVIYDAKRSSPPGKEKHTPFRERLGPANLTKIANRVGFGSRHENLPFSYPLFFPRTLLSFLFTRMDGHFPHRKELLAPA